MLESWIQPSPPVRGTFHARGRVARWLAVLLLAVSAPGLEAQDTTRVWVNLRSGVYHCAGTTYYGKTSRGTYLSEVVARERGYRANGNRLCGALPQTDVDGGVRDTARSRTRSTTTATGASPDRSPVAPENGLVRCALIHIADGDSIDCAGLGTVRLIGIDAPEADQEPYGTAASAAFAALVPLGSTLQLEYGVERRDRYGRLLAYVWLGGGEMLNWQLARQGWAVSLPWPPNTRYAAAFAAAEQRAKREGRGLWSVGGLLCRPSEHRQRRCDD